VGDQGDQFPGHISFFASFIHLITCAKISFTVCALSIYLHQIIIVHQHAKQLEGYKK